MSDHSNMSIESPASSRAATPPTLDTNQPLCIIPIGALGEATENDVANLLQTDGVTPMSPRTVASTLANHSVLDADMLWVITRGLIATIREHEAKSFEERNKYVRRINQLEDQLSEQAKKVYDDNTAPEGFEENDDNKAPVSRVPDGEGDYVVPKWVRFMDDGRVAAYAFSAPKDSLPYVIDLYAEPHLDDETPFNPMSHWYRAVLNADEARFQVLYCKTAKRGHWGHLAELKRHCDTSRTVQDLQARIAYTVWRPILRGPFKLVSYPNSACKQLGRMSWSNTRKDSSVQGSAITDTIRTPCDSSVTTKVTSVAEVG